MTEVALAPDSSPQPPEVIVQLLEKLGLAFQVRLEHPGLSAAQRVQSVLLEDAVGALLVLFPRSQLLDLNRLAELTGRKLVAVKPERLERMLGKHQLGTLPGLPPLTSSPCLYDERLLQEPRLLVESGQPGVLLELASEDYRSLLGKASAARFGEPLASIRPNLDRPADDRAEITQAVQAFTARRIQQRLEETIEIPPLAESAQKIIKLRVDPNATVEDITGVVETDPALAAQVVSWAASPYYAAPGKIRSVEDAIVRVLGFDLVINLALGLALGKSLSLPKDQPQQATPYWQQAIYTAAVIEGLTRAMPRAQRPETGLTYLAGLLHNFGYLVLAHVFPPHFSLICRHLEVNPHLSHSYIEQHLLGITREQIGSWLMRFWDMPEELYTALRFQHDADYQYDNAAYPNLVCLAVSLLRNRGIGSGPEAVIPDDLFEALGISREKADDAVNKVLQAEAALRELASQFNAPH
ncbi:MULTISPECIES: aminoacyl-tRNA deacylase and HDOD domain-containing protein [unclassified Pseudomonas]|uniref:HDOD domain-containing protein n=1 Tax=unclassified Pseudomonas TaxID=196821 RepID=UPI00245760F0|nr:MULTISPECIES: aminoacyl-tRNA deacylase and HDOD domain-containing protein [unclassified Pseudomonas]MDH4562977.1 HDOD domain-containing protein [Pseudomonas sp. BN411]MDH4871532.1 HDOD domain-containing protein [Pseudomonas sp. BN515]